MFAKEGLREIIAATTILGLFGALAGLFFWPATIPLVLVWIWVLSFFRDPVRTREYRPGDLCSPADGIITEISRLEYHESVGGPAVRIGIFLSLFDVHINRFPCSGTVRSIVYKEGEFLDARHPESGQRNESNTLLIDPDAPLPGPVEVRQVAGLVARRIISHAEVGSHWTIGQRFGLIKFGSRTELIIPGLDGTEVLIEIGDRVRGGLTILARQPATLPAGVKATDHGHGA